MSITEKSRFHWLLSGEASGARDLWDQEVLASKSFVVVPSLGALVPGWLLVVPRRAMISLRELNSNERTELDQLLDTLATSLQCFGGDVFAFEHGSDHRGSKMGCGVDHAHLHVVPLRFDLVDWATSQADADLRWTIQSRLLLTDLPLSGEYVAVWKVSTRRGALAKIDRPVSQWMRRAIATKLGVQEDWDYRTNPQMENIEATVETIRRTKLSTK